MDAARWSAVKAVFHAALERQPPERAAFLADACGADTALRAEVESLLASHETDDPFLEAPAYAAALEATDAGPPRERVGAYRLVREIGRGGMGAVYLAERDDGQFRQQVAVKLVKRGMDSESILARFRHERQILAELEHPNIARLLDGGTTEDGLPYFVMEHIVGEPVDHYCASRALGIPARLALFRDVCAAVHFAHQRLVVHRDIKPANVLVTAAGVPKLLDFGIAKLLSDGPDGRVGAPTDVALRALTPEYASPEQVRGEPVTILSDVYSLGVLLYELLAGRHPYARQGSSPADLAHAVTDTEPVRPSAVADGERTRRRLRGDLDTIVLVAMRKEAARRYASVEQLSDDARRHLAGLPVRARADTFAYRVSTFVRRNRLGVAGAGVVAASLIAGVATTTHESRVARAERARAERRFNDVRALATSFLFELHDAIASLPGSTPTRALIVRRALASLDGLARDARGDTGLERDLAAAYERIGRVQGNSYNSNLGDTEGALRSYRKALELRTLVAHDDPTNETAQSEMARTTEGLGDVVGATGDLQGALTLYDRARTIWHTLAEARPTNATYRADLAELYNAIGDIKGQEGYGSLGDMPGALASYRASVQLRERNLAESPRDVAARVGLANSLMNLGYLASTLGDSTGASQLARAVTLLESVVAELPDDAVRHQELLSAYARLRQPLVDAGRVDEAIAIDRKLLATIETDVAADTNDRLLARNLGVAYNYLGRDLRAAQRAREALSFHRRGLAIAERLAARDPKSGEHRHDVAIGHFWLAEVLNDTRDYAGALAEYRLAESGKERLRVAEPASTRHADDLARIHLGMGNALVETGALGAAHAALRDAVVGAESAAARTATNQRAKSILAATYAAVGRLHARRAASGTASREWSDARDWFAKGSAIWTAQQRSGALTALDRVNLQHVEREIARCDAALAAVH